MSEKKQSSVEWLYEKLDGMIPRSALYNGDKIRYLEQAKAMHKLEIQKAWYNSGLNSMYSPNDLIKLSEEYYNETFGE